MSSAEESLMALLEAMLTLAARNAPARPPKPQVKAGGHQEEHFVDLTEDEREEFSCNICYQILKETMQCSNNHKFCHSCLFVWSTTGQYANRIRCPVCRTHGYYFRNNDIDERIGAKKVKCLMESCSWTGLLKYLGSHRHTTYSDPNAQGSEEGSSSVTSMPRLAQASPRIPSSNTSRFVGTGLTTQGNQEVHPTPRYSLFPNATLSRDSPSSLSSTSQETVVEIPRRSNAATNTRYNNRAPLRRVPNVRASINSRITFNHFGPTTDNNNNLEDESPPLTDRSSTVGETADSSATVNAGGHTPRPPSGPRTTTNTRRLPRLVNPPPQRSRYQPPEALALSSRARPRPQENLVEIRDSLRESRSRLDSLMSTFSGELDSSRQEMIDFQLERERQRREQLEEVRELGQRLGQVASELRRLLEHRRFITSFSDNDDDENENDI
ncbi:uncharacterized protein LOC106077903 [Biomphalaria glabrata]|uniref:Uncharacterized protein LOC106077903 n=1 Tax=Biomphalaria glabrata TaxID=6526 RepID=A0A9W3A9S1_BIOGL|nr:uncharacterized protein LOC106077903 [Biomphalaria glabrata]XP_055883905.1 uncharacterized protein LOC106077903 [Biomphalaria glabrata]XP_055883906.1 uncharacterized protein LOC106077903 [Biomphalaria glabrata]XP_055883907.1 uncharacterized protein LOC106077903 [Biomphalaria glabrata]XP_055883908.1 uncharacterized protein LOC106077903 [Biomphalaria glabrata]XP_055883909.1 uncharacterized protein LOC106077903 [Biomphalaria glabrata]XP_055883910.1 uncharacterized protein LOC106077903 [Biomph